MAVLLTAAAAVSGLGLGEVVDAAAILAIVVLNSVIGLVQEGRAAGALAALRTIQTRLRSSADQAGGWFSPRAR
jgi:P-type Ca2+ transporter type 2C